jgi:16S rRNA (cytidine1402-2'-O)-methyltransferase
LADAFGADRRAALCRELTKTHEQVLRGPLSHLAAAASAAPVLGEVTLVVAGATGSVPGAEDPAELVRLVQQREAAGLSRKEAIADVAREVRRPKREVYAAVVSGAAAEAPSS